MVTSLCSGNWRVEGSVGDGCVLAGLWMPLQRHQDAGSDGGRQGSFFSWMPEGNEVSARMEYVKSPSFNDGIRSLYKKEQLAADDGPLPGSSTICDPLLVLSQNNWERGLGFRCTLVSYNLFCKSASIEDGGKINMLTRLLPEYE